MRHNPDLDEAFGVSPREPLTEGQVEALTDALNNLTQRIETEAQKPETSQKPFAPQAPSQAPPNTPWWFKYTEGKPGAPESLPPWHYAYKLGMQGVGGPQQTPEAGGGGMGGGSGGWWNRYTAAGAPEPDPERHSFVRGHWRFKRRPKPPNRIADDIDNAEEVGSGGGQARPGAWGRRRRPKGWLARFTRRAGAGARQRFGPRAGRAVQQGLGTAAQSMMWGGSLRWAARRGLTAAAVAGGPVAVGVGLLALAAVKAAEALNQLTREQLVYNRHLATASAQMALVFAERDIQETMRNREKGDRLASSARALTQAEQFKEDQWKDVEIAWNRAKNALSTAWEYAKGVFAATNPIMLQVKALEKLTQWLENHFGTGEKPLTLGEWAREAQQLDEEARKRKDPKWSPPKFN